MGALRLTTLGEPHLQHDGVDCLFSTRKTLALVCYLAVTGQPHPRARLIALLWPDADETHGYLNLRQTLVRVRKALEPDATMHLRTMRDLVQFNLGSSGFVDVARLSAALHPQIAPEHRLLAIQSYRGAFLDYLEIEDAPDFMAWVVAQRAHWEACYDRIAEQHMQMLLDDGHADTAMALGQTWVERRPDAETAYRLLATAQATRGDVHAARLTLGRATQRLNELGLELAAETEHLNANLATLPITGTATIRRQSIRLPFVGRHDAFALLRQAYQRASAKNAVVANVHGEAGLGKSRLVEAFTRWAEIQGADVAVGRAYELVRRLPYQPFMEILRFRMAREHAPDDLLDDSWLIELQRLVPELHDRYADLPMPVDDVVAGTRLLEAIAQLGKAYAQRKTVLWLLEDIHWADEATRDALLYLLQRWRDSGTSALIVLTMRDDDMAISEELLSWLAALQRAATLVDVTLMPLSAQETTQAIASYFGDPVHPDIDAWLYHETQGNPLYLEHVIQALVERGAVQWRDERPIVAAEFDMPSLGEWLPQTLREVLLRRVRRLDVVTQQVLAAAAVLGTSFREDLVAQVAGVEENLLLSSLENAERGLLIRAEADRYGFTHHKVAEALYGDLTTARRRAFHRRALQALETDGTASPGELAHHALEAKAWVQAAEYAQQAAEAAEQVGAHLDAQRFYAQVAGLLKTTPSQQVLRAAFSDENIINLYDSLAFSHLRVGETDKAHAAYNTLLKDIRSRGAKIHEGSVLLMLGKLLLEHVHDIATAHTTLEEARQIAEDVRDASGLLNAHRLLAFTALLRGDVTLAWNHAYQVVQLARESQQPYVLAKGLTALCDVAIRRGEWEEACAASEECVVLLAHLMGSHATDTAPAYQFVTPSSWPTFYRYIDALAQATPTHASNRLRPWGAFGLTRVGIARLHLGDGAMGYAAMAMAWQIYQDRNEQRFSYEFLLQRTLGCIERGEYEPILQELLQILELRISTTASAVTSTDFVLYCALIDVYQVLFLTDEAVDHLRHLQMIAADEPVWNRLLVATRWCTQHALCENWPAAHEAALQAHALRDTLPSPLAAFDFARFRETEALLRAGDRHRAEAAARYLEEHIGANRRYRLVYLRMRALLEANAENHPAACASLAEALELATSMNLPGETWQIAASLAASAMLTGDDALARQMRQQSIQGIELLASRIIDPKLRDHYMLAAIARLPELG